MKILFNICFAVLLLVACNPATHSAKVKPSIENLTRITLPFTQKCATEIPVYDKDSIHQFISGLPGNLRFSGLMKNTPVFAAVILVDTYADYELPYLVTVNKEGRIIDQFRLFSTDQCGEDEYYKGQASYTIDKDLKITQKDSVATYERTDDGEISKETVVVSTHTFQFYVDERGKVKKIHQ